MEGMRWLTVELEEGIREEEEEAVEADGVLAGIA